MIVKELHVSWWGSKGAQWLNFTKHLQPEFVWIQSSRHIQRDGDNFFVFSLFNWFFSIVNFIKDDFIMEKSSKAGFYLTSLTKTRCKRATSVNSEMLLDFSLTAAGDVWLHLQASCVMWLPHPSPGTGSPPSHVSAGSTHLCLARSVGLG